MKKTAENDFNKAVECIVKSDFYNDLNKCLDMVKLLDKNKKLQERIEDLNTINEEHKILNGMIRKELQQKENIIKEVREYIESNKIYTNEKQEAYTLKNTWYGLELLGILDKEK